MIILLPGLRHFWLANLNQFSAGYKESNTYARNLHGRKRRRLRQKWLRFPNQKWRRLAQKWLRIRNQKWRRLRNMWLRFGNQKWQAFFWKSHSSHLKISLAAASQRASHWQCKGKSSRRSCKQDLCAKAIAAKWRQAAARPARQRGRALLPGGDRPLPKGVRSSARLRRASRAAPAQCTAIKSRGVGRRARSATRGAVGTALDPRFVTVRNMIISVTMCSERLFNFLAEKWLRIRNQKWHGFLAYCLNRFCKMHVCITPSKNVWRRPKGAGRWRATETIRKAS